MDGTSTSEKTKKRGNSKDGGGEKPKKPNTAKLLRARHCIGAALNHLHEFEEFHAELSAFREKVWNRFLELER